MKPLSERQAKIARALAVDGPLRLFAKPLFRAALAGQVQWFAARMGAPRTLPEGKVTAVIKTFERPRRCKALVASIRRGWPDLPIIVVDDSRAPGDYPGCRVIRLPFNVGLSAGRNAGLAAVETEYVLNLDDDFLFERGTAVDGALALLEQHPQVDLLAGLVIDLPLLIRHDSSHARLFGAPPAPIIAAGTMVGPVRVMDKVPNFFLARTAAVKAIGWDPELKLLEHADFFSRARGRIVSAQWDGWRILHQRDPFDRHYRIFRDNAAESLAHLKRKYGLGSPPSAA
ncbi:glycosyltransferase [Sphingomonas lutea]|uniref:Glycosyltransferase n=1 Tax=Sphingomonas lutea TaxID=1045317 RepID=A0A7G9SH38_9SPHN|nr:glycosyltransferase [Sphingomonas lutea]QNN67163.1 glycosyltransferase [Sphingomonas lutea]